MLRSPDLAAELKLVIRLAGRDPEALEGRLALLGTLQRVRAHGPLEEAARVHLIVHRVIPELLELLPASRDCMAIRELMRWEDDDGEARSLTTRYHRASAHLVNAAHDFGRRQEPRLLLEAARRFIALDHDDRLAAAAPPPLATAVPDALSDDPSLSPLAPLLWAKAEHDHRRRLAAIRGGVFSVPNQEEMFELLVTMLHAAQHTLHAVDRTDLERWFGIARMQRYLDLQLERARSGAIGVERLRFIRRDRLEQPLQRNLLREFIRLHDDAGATLLLCPDEAFDGQHTGFDARMFMVLVDVDSAPACLTGWLGTSGYIERSLVYLRDLDPVRTHYADLLRLKEHIALHRYTEGIRALLADHDDPPLEPDAVRSRSLWGPLAEPR